MKSRIFKYIPALLLSAVITLLCGEASAQQHPERRIIRSGNRSYDADKFTDAENSYRKALEKVPLSYEGAFNLSDALYRQEKYDEAAGLLKNLSESPTISAEQRSKIFYNLGNTMFRQNKLQEAADYYKESLRSNPSDMDAKYNLAYVQRLMQQNEDNKNNQNDQNNKDNSDKNGDDKQDDKDQNKDKQGDGKDDKDKSGDDGQNKNDSDGEQDKQNDSDEQQPEKPKPQDGEGGQGRINRENAESILNAIQQQEDNTREKVNNQKTVSVGRSGKNW